ncbi:Protein of unknown function [Bacillus wiedmannii]|nr:Protein of unknown function [Bacillus wiedmannii]
MGFKQYNDSFKKWLLDMMFTIICNTEGEVFIGNPQID